MMELRTRNPNRSANHRRQRCRLMQLSWTLGVFLLATWLTATPVSSVAQTADKPEPERPVSNLSIDTDGDRYLMLQNGNVFHGKIEKVEHKWKVTINQGTSLFLENHKVRVIADSLEDIYFYQSQRISPYDAQLRVELVRWCLRNKLVQQAEAELKQMESLRIDPQTRSSLAFQLKQMTNPEQTPSIAASLKASSEQLARNRQSTPKEPRRTTLNQSPLQMATGPVQNPLVPMGSGSTGDLADNRASLQSDAIRSGSFQPQRPHALSPTLEPAATPERQRMAALPSPNGNHQVAEAPVASVFNIYNVPGAQPTPEAEMALKNSLPQAVVEQFSANVHSVIVDSCAGCHFEGNPEMEGKAFSLQLVSQKNPAASIRNNLQQVVKLINRSNPGNSELLDIATKAHGGLEKSPLPEDAQLQEMLSSWVFSTRSDGMVPPDSSGSKVMLAGAQTEVPANASRLQPHSPAAIPEAPAVDNRMPASPLGLQPRLNPQNPFDPSVFNEWHGTAPQPSIDSPTVDRPAPTTPVVSPETPARPAAQIPRPTSLFQLQPATRNEPKPLVPAQKTP